MNRRPLRRVGCVVGGGGRERRRAGDQGEEAVLLTEGGWERWRNDD